MKHLLPVLLLLTVLSTTAQVNKKELERREQELKYADSINTAFNNSLHSLHVTMHNLLSNRQRDSLSKGYSMKYLVTWFIVSTVDTNHGPTMILSMQTTKDRQTVEFKNRDAALKLYDMQLREYNHQFTDSTHTYIPCPKCYHYISSVQLDSMLVK